MHRRIELVFRPAPAQYRSNELVPACSCPVAVLIQTHRHALVCCRCTSAPCCMATCHSWAEVSIMPTYYTIGQSSLNLMATCAGLCAKSAHSRGGNIHVVHCSSRSTDAPQGQLLAGCQGSFTPSIKSHQFSYPKDEKCKSHQNPHHQNLSHNPSKTFRVCKTLIVRTDEK